ncbi:1-acyl-sn-glycerol-3-phosphate acyltransferase protein, putative [Cryptosporidium muris RN66]|uniref:1-acyl-sn-glycerol-3-phosphate acyltransferase protein, putative n=1 Tax=Cryptosporidium muris (strain RN66) TaxID=441375 RepID=B6AAX5_CRYMR|nr:1-acyl-sn-glycerol-3-phosphate acyltransferase protein, putative [Cryptosporidium muris RN66]EEA05527.1 1-acyl-sn-glycerol-3-phosphate acyltransferase protein, putative [Cryptosporidium muris RN66]|eukprot:XP_002139876.1 1-acyl-sn-glycerol-3-phosphate acyltransferase protein [Cryptosporidium muris RN66]
MSSSISGESSVSPNKFKKSTTPTILRIIVSIYIYMMIILAVIFGFITQVTFWILLFPYLLTNEYFKIKIMGMAFRFWCNLLVVWLNPFWKVVIVRNPPKSYKPRRTILMSNHLSSADPWIICSSHFPWELKYVYKADLIKIPIVGWVVQMTYDMPIYFTGDKSGWGVKSGTTQLLFKRCTELQEIGFGQVVFPEGTRSKLRRLQPFRNGFFRFAIENKCEILPVVMHNNWTCWPLGETLMDIGTIYVAYGDPIKLTEDTNIEELKEIVKNSMLDLLKYCPTYNPELEQPISRMASSRGHGIIG